MKGHAGHRQVIAVAAVTIVRSMKSDSLMVGLVDHGHDAKRSLLAVSALSALRVGDCDARRRPSMVDPGRRGRREKGRGSVYVSVSTNANGKWREIRRGRGRGDLRAPPGVPGRQERRAIIVATDARNHLPERSRS